MNRRLQDGLRNARVAAAVFACLAGLHGPTQAARAGAAAASTRADQPAEWSFPRARLRAPGPLAEGLQLATIDGAQCWADGLCRFAGCQTPDPDCGPSNLPPPDIDLSISRHTSSTLSDTTADQILEAASETLQVNNGGGDDVPCDVTLERSGTVTTFSTGDGSIDSQQEYDAVIALPGKVKVVNQITWCGGIVSAAGCAPVPGGSQIVVIQGLSHLDGIVWAHEYGHTQGLNHRAVDNTRFVMNSSVAGRSTRVSTVECDAIR
jgi:hypothetical protein